MFEAGIQLYNYMETFFCCTVNQKEEFKSVVQEHMLVYVVQGELDALMEAKIKEVILTLVEIMPELKSVLFDFHEPFKIDLVAFMDANFASDLDVEGFAHYTGRSLSAFKKEFGEIFGEAPGKWIISRRLQEAKTLMENGAKPLDVYLTVGFKNLSHFSTAFKRQYGYPPSSLVS